MSFLGAFGFRKGTVGGVLPIGSLLTLNGTDAILWLDGDLDVYSDSGSTPSIFDGLVVTWGDQTTYLNNATQTAFTQTYRDGHGGWNNLDFIEFSGQTGSSNLLVNNDASFSALTELTILLAIKGNITDTWANGDVIIQHTDNFASGGTVDGWDLVYNNNLGSNELVFTYVDSSAGLGYNRLTIPFNILSQTLYTFRVSGDTIDAWTGSTDSPIWTNSTGNGMDELLSAVGISIGSFYRINGGPEATSNAPVDFGSIVMYGGPLSNSDVKLVQDNLVAKYNF